MAQQTGGRAKAFVFLAMAIGVATIASMAVLRILQESQKQLEQAQKPPDTFPVVVATTDLHMGIPIGVDDVAVRELLPEMIPPEVTFETVEEVVGRTPREPILTNEMIRTERLARRDAGIGLNALITPGKRAMALSTSLQTSVAGFIRPGNFVDIMITIAPDMEQIEQDFIAETILQQVKVLAAGSQMEQMEEGGNKKKKKKSKSLPSITVEVTLEEAEKLALAQSKGKLWIVLRSDVDIAEQDVARPTDVSKLIGFEPTKKAKTGYTPAATRAPVRQTATSEVISGSRTSQIEFDASGQKR